MNYLSAAGRLRQAALTIAVGGVLVVGLAACVPSPGATPQGSLHATQSTSATPSASASSSATPSTSPSASPTASPTTPPAATAVKIDCNTLVSPQVIYSFNHNFGPDTSYAPLQGTPAALAVTNGGTACNWVNQTSGDNLTVSVARPAAAQLASIKATAAKGTAGAGLGDSSYFSSSGGIGRVDVFSGGYWLVTTSILFASSSDAASIVNAALGSLN